MFMTVAPRNDKRDVSYQGTSDVMSNGTWL
jgi:hypothetical protein